MSALMKVQYSIPDESLQLFAGWEMEVKYSNA